MLSFPVIAEPSLTLLEDAYPKAMYFRYVSPSPKAAPVGDDSWLRRWRFLDGIVVGALDDEIFDPKMPMLPKVNAYKKAYPEKVALLHMAGSARPPVLANAHFSPKHLLTYAGVTLQDTLSSEATRLKIPSKFRDVFQLNSGRGKRTHDELVITGLLSNGQPDFANSEYARLVAKPNSNEIVVERGIYGSRANTYRGYYVAPIMSSGPWRPFSDLKNWKYNFAQHAFSTGEMSVVDLLADEIAAWFSPKGKFAHFDGVVFDTMVSQIGVQAKDRGTGLDLNGDGIFDRVDIDAKQAFEEGVLLFHERLRKKVGKNVLLLADGHRQNHQRSLGILNGIESECWPNHFDVNFADWSGGINRHLMWADNGFAPPMNYIRVGPLNSDERKAVPLTSSMRRLMVAGAMLTDAVIVPVDKGFGRFHQWPELTGGEKGYSHWLGRRGVQRPIWTDVAGHSSSVTVLDKQGRQRVKPGDGLTIEPFPNRNKPVQIIVDKGASADVLMTFESALTSQRRTPLWVNATIDDACGSGQQTSFLARKQQAPQRIMFTGLATQQETCTILLNFEEPKPVRLQSLRASGQAESAIQVYEHGFVAANPSSNPQNFGLPEGFTEQCSDIVSADKSVNISGKQFTVPAKDAVYVKKRC